MKKKMLFCSGKLWWHSDIFDYWEGKKVSAEDVRGDAYKKGDEAKKCLKSNLKLRMFSQLGDEEKDKLLGLPWS